MICRLTLNGPVWNLRSNCFGTQIGWHRSAQQSQKLPRMRRERPLFGVDDITLPRYIESGDPNYLEFSLINFPFHRIVIEDSDARPVPDNLLYRVRRSAVHQSFELRIFRSEAA